MTYRKTESATIAAAKALFSAATGYRIENDPRLPSQTKSPRTRRRADPLGDLFETEILPMLEEAPALRPVAIFEEMLRRLMPKRRFPQIVLSMDADQISPQPQPASIFIILLRVIR